MGESRTPAALNSLPLEKCGLASTDGSQNDKTGLLGQRYFGDFGMPRFISGTNDGQRNEGHIDRLVLFESSNSQQLEITVLLFDGLQIGLFQISLLVIAGTFYSLADHAGKVAQDGDNRIDLASNRGKWCFQLRANSLGDMFLVLDRNLLAAKNSFQN